MIGQGYIDFHDTRFEPSRTIGLIVPPPAGLEYFDLSEELVALDHSQTIIADSVEVI